jgi:hypothetical protein
MELDEFFDGYDQSRRLFDTLLRMIGELGPVQLNVTKSQVAFRRRKAFAWTWVPGKYLRGKFAPLVVTISLPGKDTSPRWKEIVEPYPGRFIHHLELYSVEDLDEEVRGWLLAACQAAN